MPPGMGVGIALFGAAVIAGAHGGVHYVFGETESFDEAAVRPAGATVFVASFIMLLVATGT